MSLTTLFLMALPVLAEDSTPRDLRTESTESIERQAVEALASGRPVDDLLAEIRRRAAAGDPANRDGLSAPPVGREAAEVNRALAGLARLGDRLAARAERASPEDDDELIAAYENLLAADLLFRARLESVRDKLAQLSLSEEIASRAEAAQASYDRDMRPLVEALGDSVEILRQARLAAGDDKSREPPTKAEIATARDSMIAALIDARRELARRSKAPERPAMRGGLLPFRQSLLPPRPPQTEPVIVPSYAEISDLAPAPEDSVAGSQTPLSDSILLQAEDLGYDYVEIFEFVKNEVELEWYAGAMKGAEETLAQGSGNDVDQASLLIALLRASGIPARYVHGVVRLPLAELKDDLALAPDAPAEGVLESLARAGVAHSPVIQGGVVAAVDVEHTWVSARVPYSNYRGVVVDLSGATWVPLAPAVKRHTFEPSGRVLEQMEADGFFEADQALASYLATAQPADPLTVMRDAVVEFLGLNMPGTTVDQVLGSRTVEPEILELLPSTLPFEVITVTAESAELGDRFVHEVRVSVFAAAEAGGQEILSYRTSLADLVNRRVTVSYLPATADDQRVTNSFGGFGLVPLYLIQLRPQVKVAGRPVRIGETPIDAGVLHRMEIAVTGPFGEERVQTDLISGSYYALGLGAQSAAAREDPGDDPADTEFRAARLLSQLALGYSEQWDAAERELAGLFDVAVIRPLPSVVVASNQVAVEMLAGLPEQIRWEGVGLDAALRVAEPLGRSRESDAADWTAWAALHGSALEHFVFERQYLVEGISADKGLGAARDAGVEVLVLDSSNIAAELPGLDHPDNVKADIDNWVRQGNAVEVPRERIQIRSWLGSVWRVIDPDERGAGYFISGGLAGGATTESPPNWVLDFLAEAFSTPYSPEPGNDPLAGVEILKLPGSDAQEGVVGEVLPQPLMVLVRDRDGLPVKDAEVLFSITTISDAELTEPGVAAGAGQQILVLTDALGVASVELKLGTDTNADPVYVRRNAGDEFATRASYFFVEAVANSAQGPLVLDDPFSAFAFPGEPETLIRTDPHFNPQTGGAAGTWVDRIFVQVEDEFGNPISNQPVTFSVGAFEIPSDCSNAGANPINAVVFRGFAGDALDCPNLSPVLGECGAPSLTNDTSALGTSAGVILGNITVATYNVEVSSPGLPSLSFSYDQNYNVLGDGVCLRPLGLRVASTTLVDEAGNVISATRPGDPWPEPVEFTLQWPRVLFTVESDINSEGEVFFFRQDKTEVGEWLRVRGDVSMFGTNGASVAGPRPVADGSYEGDVTSTGSSLGENDVKVTITSVTALVSNVDSQTGQVTEGVESIPLIIPFTTTVDTIWSVDPDIDQYVPDPIILTAGQKSEQEVSIEYSINPTGYNAATALIDLFENNSRIGFVVAPEDTGSGKATLQRGLEFDADNIYEAELVLNRGSVAEVRGDRVELKLSEPIFERADRSVRIDLDVDLLNERVCLIAGGFTFALNHEADITLAFAKIDALDTDGNPSYGDEIVILDGETLPEGPHSVSLTPQDLPAGDYEIRLSGISSIDGHEEEILGRAVSEFRTRDSLPVGHAVVKGVDLWDGHLGLSRDDFSVPARGADFGFSRSYSSNGGKDIGALGAGWSHNWASRVVVNRCGEFIVIGGAGSGMRFVADAEGGFVPLKGYHGSLQVAEEGVGVDFYTKNGTRYHYGLPYKQTFFLEFVEDPNGNTTRLDYQLTVNGPKLLSVTGPASRMITFTYSLEQFEFQQVEVITNVNGPGGMSMSFTYDDLGNQTSAKREGGARSESYGYASENDGSLLDKRHVMTSLVNDVNGATTSYEFTEGVIRATADVVAPSIFYTKVTAPEGGNYTFSYDLSGLESRAPPELTTTVNAPAGTTVYRMNQYGSTTRISDAAGGTTSMTWAEDDVVMLSRNNANGVSAIFDYDDDGNLLSEATAGETQTFDYASMGSFSPPFIKTKVASSTNRNGVKTTFDYDSRGNLLSQTIGGLTTRYSYSSNGDRISATDPEGRTTTFGYDSYGNVSRVTDPEGGVTRTEYDTRGRPKSRTDPEGRTTTFSYDNLDREIERRRPLGATERTVYSDASRMLAKIDAEGRRTETFFDREGRVIRIQDAEGGTKEISFDTAGNKTLESNFFGPGTPRANTTFSHDGLGRVTTRTEPLGRVTTFSYDGVGNVLNETLSGSGVTRTTIRGYDDLNRVTSVRKVNPSGPDEVTTFAYDGAGNKIRETDALGRVTTMTYDDLNRRTAVLQPLGKATRFSYDGAGNVTEERREGGAAGVQVRRFTYDGLNRVISRRDAVGGTTLFEYDRVGNLTREIDPMLNAVSNSYDDLDRRVRTSQTVGGSSVVTEFSYDLVGNVTEERLPNGNLVRHTYDDLNRRVSSSDDLGSLGTFGYDAAGNLVSETDANGNLTTSTYDLLDRVTAQSLPAGRSVSFSYDVVGNRLSETDPEGNTTSFEYDGLNRVTAINLPLGLSETATYDAVGNKLTETDRNGNTVTFTYDDLNQVTSRIGPSPLGLTTTFTNDAQGNRLTDTNARGIVTEFTYDKENRLTQTRKAGLVVERFQYDPNGNARFVTDANGHTTGFEYDERNLLTAENRPLAAITEFVRDAMGDVVENVDPESRVTRFTYDERRRRLSETNAAGDRTESTYDGNGNRTSLKLPEGNTTTFGYDDADRLVSVINALGEQTTYAFDLNGNNTSQTDAESNTTSFEYDALNRLTAKVYPGGARQELEYDGNGNVTRFEDAKGQVITSVFDVENRETDRTFSLPAAPSGDDLQSIVTTYDGTGNPTMIAEAFTGATGTRTTTQAFDDFDRKVSVTNGDGKTTTYGYDANGNRTRLTDPDGRVTTYSFDALNRATGVVISGVGVTEYTHFKDSRLRRTRYPNGTEARNTYDAAGRLETIRNLQGAAVLSSYTYSYDANGNRTQQEEVNGAAAEITSYAYDLADRLTEVVYPDQTVSYSYDAVGNRLTEFAVEAGTGATLVDKAFAYDARNQLTTLTNNLDPAQNVVYGFDLNGNQVSKTQTGVTTDFTYDVRNQLVEVRTAGALVGTYLYDFAGLRVAKRVGTGDTIRYVYDERSVLLQTDNVGGTIAKYDYGADRLLSLGHATEGRQFYLFDGLASVATLTDMAGGVMARYQYDAWGNFRAQTGASANPFLFTGLEKDEETGLFYAKARFYDPEIGRFLSEDPVQGSLDAPPSLHRYLYAFGNPTVFVDPEGELGFRKDFRENADQTQDFLNNQLDNLQGRNAFFRVVGGFGIGLLKGAVEVGDKAVGAVNAVANVGVLVLPASDEIREEAALELDQTVQGVKAAVNGGVEVAKQIAEDPAAAGAKAVELAGAVKDKAFETGIKIAEGDARAIGELTSGVVEIAAEVAIGGKGAGGAAGRAGKVADAAVDTGRTVAGAGRALAQTGRVAGAAAVRGTQAAGRLVGEGLQKLAGAAVLTARGVQQVAGNIKTAVSRARASRQAAQRAATDAPPLALPAPTRVPNAGGRIVSDVTRTDETFFRVFSGDSQTGSFLTRVRPRNRGQAVEGLALPPQNTAEFIQEVLVPAGTRLQRSRALPAFGRRGGREQFELLERIPDDAFREGVPFE